ncbi:hypothetical protein G6O67_004178 [Ophiocordyceps sinensis]|uniref:Alpha-1,3-mannosyltransferase n=1 Tax=Ophiocordyceps sinensis TaxID=72228 RepID=A0A8H4LZQ4_9HYPO|nr:hypothetical protein G6O67_004178 [Ophiocordyceps sinensis]
MLLSIACLSFFCIRSLSSTRQWPPPGAARKLDLEPHSPAPQVHDGSPDSSSSKKGPRGRFSLSSVVSARRPSFNEKFTRVVNSISGDMEFPALLQPVQGTGVDKLRAIGLRARKYKEYFEAWEELHLFLDEQGVGYVRDDVIQQIRHHFKKSLLDESVPGGLAETIRSYEACRHLMAKLGQLLFPWTAPYFPSHTALHSHFKRSSRGIVLTAGDAGAPFLIPSIRSLRKLGCTLPIEIMYMGDSDLGEPNRAEFERLDGVTTRDFSRMVDDEGWKLSGWAAKPFAILFSSFRQVIFIDADGLFFRNPERLFDDPGYIKTGALFFKDRVILPQSRKEWLQKMLPEPISQQVMQSRFWTGESGHVQDSGVVVVDKWRHFVALLMVARMNGPDRYGDEGTTGVYDMVFGDKETFWLGWELVGDVDYAFHRGGVGTMGVVQEPEDEAESNKKPGSNEQVVLSGKDTAVVGTDERAGRGGLTERKRMESSTICAPQILHMDSDGRPLWFNGWIAENKFADGDQRRFAKFEHFLVEPREVGETAFWQLRTGNICCLTAKSGVKGKFTLEEEETLNMIMRLAKGGNTTGEL